MKIHLHMVWICICKTAKGISFRIIFFKKFNCCKFRTIAKKCKHVDAKYAGYRYVTQGHIQWRVTFSPSNCY